PGDHHRRGPTPAVLLPAGGRGRVPFQVLIAIGPEPDAVAVQRDLFVRHVHRPVEVLQLHPLRVAIDEAHVRAAAVARFRTPFRARLDAGAPAEAGRGIVFGVEGSRGRL